MIPQQISPTLASTLSKVLKTYSFQETFDFITNIFRAAL